MEVSQLVNEKIAEESKKSQATRWQREIDRLLAFEAYFLPLNRDGMGRRTGCGASTGGGVGMWAPEMGIWFSFG